MLLSIRHRYVSLETSMKPKWTRQDNRLVLAALKLARRQAQAGENDPLWADNAKSNQPAIVGQKWAL